MEYQELAKRASNRGPPIKEQDNRPCIEGGKLTATEVLKENLSSVKPHPDLSAEDLVYLAKAAEQAERYEGTTTLRVNTPK